MPPKKTAIQLRDRLKNLQIREESATEDKPSAPKRKELVAPVLPFGHALSDAETASIQENIITCEEKDHYISKRIQEVKVLIEKFKQQKAENERQITALKWSLSTARRLADDALIEILKISVLDFEISPYLLAQVCKKFQRILVHIPKVRSNLL
ncbi:hypothetical protein CPB86DRAFT_473688 [Serendipita vermifera]|nr:hypothetical protein CPB86DRAFT_473688 [Serendipita vermifera]